MNVRNSPVVSTRFDAMIRASRPDQGGVTVKRTIARALIVSAIFASIPPALLAQPGSLTDRDALARELRSAWRPLESGLAVSESEGIPISAMNGDAFSEIIVDYSAGMITRVGVITDRVDLAAARGQKEAHGPSHPHPRGGHRRGGQSKPRVPSRQRHARPKGRPSPSPLRSGSGFSPPREEPSSNLIKDETSERVPSDPARRR